MRKFETTYGQDAVAAILFALNHNVTEDEGIDLNRVCSGLWFELRHFDAFEMASDRTASSVPIVEVWKRGNDIREEKLAGVVWCEGPVGDRELRVLRGGAANPANEGG